MYSKFTISCMGNKYFTLPGTGINHRLDGPAQEWKNGTKLYYVCGHRYHNFVEYIKDVIKYKKAYKIK